MRPDSVAPNAQKESWDNPATGTKKRFQQTAIEYFFSKIEMCPISGCWLWAGSDKKGYGDFSFNHRAKTTAHRASWMFFRGEIPSGIFVLHKCDVPACCNPDHLFLGTALDNSKDMISKGRNISSPGEKNGCALINENTVREIRSKWAFGETGRKIAKEHHVSASLVSLIVRGEIWKHVQSPFDFPIRKGIALHAAK